MRSPNNYFIPVSFFILTTLVILACSASEPTGKLGDPGSTSIIPQHYRPESTDLIISRSDYRDKLHGFWLGQCIANWTGLITEMDKIGSIGEFDTGPFYTRDDWGQADQPNIWNQGQPSEISTTIDFVLVDENGVWGADDDTDIEYMYQHLLYTNQTSLLTAQEIRDGWLKHIRPDEENYLWVSNQQAFDLMREGVLPPETSDPEKNPHHEMIDAQLTTEIFGLFAPGYPDLAIKMARLPIRTTARQNAAWISEFYVRMYALASLVDDRLPMKEQINWMAHQASRSIPPGSYTAHMFEYVRSKYESGISWEQTRDSIYVRYQVDEMDGYDITSQDIYCNGCFAAGINFAASLVSLFYGEGDLKETIKIGVLTGWDADNPTATWGGLLGFMLGRDAVEKVFNQKLSNQFNIHRTRQNFPNNGLDTFENMAKTGISIIDRVVKEELGGGVNFQEDIWYIPQP